MKIKTAGLTGIALDWAVAQCEGEPVELRYGLLRYKPSQFTPEQDAYNPADDWSLAGPIIEREGISLLRWGYSWDASASRGPKVGQRFEGQTPLIAAMRCYVASKLGNEVDVPDELAGA